MELVLGMLSHLLGGVGQWEEKGYGESGVNKAGRSSREGGDRASRKKNI